jgi:hypothetical protein
MIRKGNGAIIEMAPFERSETGVALLFLDEHASECQRNAQEKQR